MKISKTQNKILFLRMTQAVMYLCATSKKQSF